MTNIKLLIYSLSESDEMTGPNIRIFGLAKYLSIAGASVILCVPGKVYSIVHGVVYPKKSFHYIPRKLLIVIHELAKIPSLTFLVSFLTSFLYGLYSFILLRGEKPDLIQVEESITSGTLLVLILKILFRKPLVLDKHNILYSLIKDVTFKFAEGKSFLKRISLSFFLKIIYLIEALGISIADLVLVVSEVDKGRLIQTFSIPGNKVLVIPNGVDLSKYSQNVQVGLAKKEEFGLKDKFVILFTGGLNYIPNLLAVKEFLERVFPRILKVQRDVFFVVVGHTTSDVAGKHYPNVIFTGYVKDEVPLVNMADICIAPLTIGSGTRIKILNYMACRKAVVTTPKGAEGLKISDGKDIVISDIDSFHEKIIHLIRNPEIRSIIGFNARKTIEKFYSWRDITLTLLQAYINVRCMSRGKSRSSNTMCY